MDNELIAAIGAQWKYRYYNRLSFIGDKHAQLDKHFPELKKGGKKVLDVSCGTGVLLEILNYYGNETTGIEWAGSIFRNVLDTQGIDWIKHDCSKVPYPFPDKSFDYVICIAAIDQYRVPWAPIVQEFMRLAKEVVFVLPNRGQTLEDNRQALNHCALPGWGQSCNEDTYTWTYRA